MSQLALRSSPRASREVRRAQILEAARQCFAERGYHGASMDDLVRASGLSKGSLYWHFESKEDVLLGLLDAMVAETLSVWAEADEGSRPVLDVLEAGAEMAFRALADPSMMKAWVEFLAHPVARERLATVYAQTREQVESLLQRGVERGELEPAGAQGAAAAFLGLAEGLGLQALVDPDFDLAACWPAAMKLLRRGLER